MVALAPGNYTLNVQVLKWGGAADSHIDVFAHYNGYSPLLWHKVVDLWERAAKPPFSEL